jgi:uncharacterized protein (TIGR02268 family)
VSHLPPLFLLLALTTAPAAFAQDAPPSVQPEANTTWESPVRRITLRAGSSPGEPPSVQVSPGKATVLLFDTPLSRVEVGEAARFGRVRLHADTVTLVPSARLAEGLRFRLMVHFADGAAPASVEFQLVVHAAVAEQQVFVDRMPRAAEALEADLEASEGRVRRLTEEVTRLERAQGWPGGLVGMLVAGHMGEGGVAAWDLSEAFRKRPRNALGCQRVVAFRGAESLALRVELGNPPGAALWRAEGAVLVDRDGAALPVRTVFHEPAIAPGATGHVLVEVEATSTTSSGPYTLTLWAVGGVRPVVLGDLVFPSAPIRPLAPEAPSPR